MMEGEARKMNEETESAHKQLFDDKLGWDRGRRPEVNDGIGSEKLDTQIQSCEGQQHLILHNNEYVNVQ